MSAFLMAATEFAREHALLLAAGTTLLLAAFALAVRASRSPATKNRLASTAMLATLAYLIAALVPMPRVARDWTLVATPTATTPSSQQHPSQQHLVPKLALDRPSPAASDVEFVRAEPTTTTDATPLPAPRLAATKQPLEGVAAQPNDAAAFEFAPWLTIALLLGAACCTAQLLLGLWQLQSILRQSQPASTKLRQLIALPRRTRLCITTAAVQPFCFGLLFPTIVLPQRLACATAETRFILLHERAHLTSGDTRARCLAALLRPLLFWHPLYWWLQRQLRFTSELLADDAAAEGAVAAYVRCMMTLATHPDRATGGALVATIFRRRSELFRRLEMMLQRDEAIPRSHSRLGRCLRAASALALVAVCAGTFGVETAVAQSPSQERAREQIAQLQAELRRLRQEIAELQSTERAPEAGGTNPIEALQPPAAGLSTGRLIMQLPQPLPPRLAPGAATAEVEYTVQAGDSFASIAKRFLGSAKRTRDLVDMNPQIDPRRLSVGDKLKLKLPALPLTLGKPASVQLPEVPQSPTTPAAEEPPVPNPAFGGFPTVTSSNSSDAPAPVANHDTNQADNRGRTSAPSNSELANLITHYLELRGDVEIQEVHLRHAQSDKEKEIAEIQLRTKLRQHKALAAMLHNELQAATVELERAETLAEAGFVQKSDLFAIKNRVAMLKRALT